MAEEKLVDQLNSLIQLDIDAVHAYDQAIAQIDDQVIKSKIQTFQDDHRRHVADLSNEVRALGGTPTEFSRDFKGFLIEGFTALRSATGTDGALKAMKQNEELTNKTYREAVSWELSPTARAIVEKNAGDEELHLRYITETISRR